MSKKNSSLESVPPFNPDVIVSLSDASHKSHLASKLKSKTVPVLPSLNSSHIYLHLLHYPVHPTGFSFDIFLDFLVILILLSSNNNNIVCVNKCLQTLGNRSRYGMYYETEKSASVRYFDAFFIHNIRRVSDRL